MVTFSVELTISGSRGVGSKEPLVACSDGTPGGTYELDTEFSGNFLTVELSLLMS